MNRLDPKELESTPENKQIYECIQRNNFANCAKILTIMKEMWLSMYKKSSKVSMYRRSRGFVVGLCT